jgi:hypothetical protein
MNATSEPEKAPEAVVRRALSTPDGAHQPSPWPRRIAILVAIMTAVCVGGLFVGYRAYDNATKPNRSAPDVVVDNYLRAFLDHRDDGEAAQYACTDQAGLASFRRFRDQIEATESATGVDVALSWGALTTTRSGDAAVVSTVIRETAALSGAQQVLNTDWSFEVRRSGDWRVCSASRSPSQPVASPSP